MGSVVVDDTAILESVVVDDDDADSLLEVVEVAEVMVCYVRCFLCFVFDHRSSIIASLRSLFFLRLISHDVRTMCGRYKNGGGRAGGGWLID